MTARARSRSAVEDMTLMLRADEIRWSLDEPEPATREPAVAVKPPSRLTASRADLVTWWRWRYSTLKAENARLADLLGQALGEAQSYRQVLQACLDASQEQGRRHDRLREQHRRLRDEYRSHGERVLRGEQRTGRRTEV